MTYVLQSNPVNAVYTPRGGAAELIYSRDPEVVIVGPAETGKTLAACWKLHTLACKYPRSQWAIVRKTYKSMPGSVLQTFARVIRDAPVIPYGKERPEKYIYANGSEIWIGGMDSPDKVLSSERDGIYVNQAEELGLADWETLRTRTTGRGAIVPHPQLFGDANPGGSMHWIRERNKSEKLRMIKSIHKDNPTLYTDDGVLTEQGKRTMQALQGLTGVRYKRLYLGEWATAEGAVYDIFNHEIHVKIRNPKEFKWFAFAMDEGYVNPATILVIGVDGDNRVHIFREYYKRGQLQSTIVAEAKKRYDSMAFMGAPVREIIVDDAAAGLIADLRNAGLPARGAEKGRVNDGIAKVADMLKVQGDGKPRCTIDPSCVNTINEFESYVWKPEKDEPVKENDHAMDPIRYFVDRLSLPSASNLIGFAG